MHELYIMKKKKKKKKKAGIKSAATDPMESRDMLPPHVRTTTLHQEDGSPAHPRLYFHAIVEKSLKVAADI